MRGSREWLKSGRQKSERSSNGAAGERQSSSQEPGTLQEQRASRDEATQGVSSKSRERRDDWTSACPTELGMGRRRLGHTRLKAKLTLSYSNPEAPTDTSTRVEANYMALVAVGNSQNTASRRDSTEGSRRSHPIHQLAFYFPASSSVCVCTERV